jgi:hypothetical protein
VFKARQELTEAVVQFLDVSKYPHGGTVLMSGAAVHETNSAARSAGGALRVAQRLRAR